MVLFHKDNCTKMTPEEGLGTPGSTTPTTNGSRSLCPPAMQGSGRPGEPRGRTLLLDSSDDRDDNCGDKKRKPLFIENIQEWQAGNIFLFHMDPGNGGL